MKGTCVLLAMHWPAFREGLGALLRACDGLEVVGVAATADEAMSLARGAPLDVLLIDQHMPGALRAASGIREIHPEVAVIVLVDRLDPDQAARLAAAGATGFPLSEVGWDGFPGALRRLSGRRTSSQRAGDGQAGGPSPRICTPHRPKASDALTAREVDILQHLAEGRTAKQIASALAVTEGTVKTHVRHILQKLGARNRTQAIADALRHGVIR